LLLEFRLQKFLLGLRRGLCCLGSNGAVRSRGVGGRQSGTLNSGGFTDSGGRIVGYGTEVNGHLTTHGIAPAIRSDFKGKRRAACGVSTRGGKVCLFVCPDFAITLAEDLDLLLCGGL
jgi:hypothetical protein